MPSTIGFAIPGVVFVVVALGLAILSGEVTLSNRLALSLLFGIPGVAFLYRAKIAYE